MKTGDLLITGFGRGIGFNGTRSDNINGAKGITGPVKELLPLQRPGAFYDLVQAVHFFPVQPQGEAQTFQTAVTAGHFNVRYRNNFVRRHLEKYLFVNGFSLTIHEFNCINDQSLRLINKQFQK